MQLYNHRSLLAVYFVQGILGLSRLGVSFMYKDEFHLEPASVRPPAASPWLSSHQVLHASPILPVLHDTSTADRSCAVVCLG